jgi:hypothetical protein
MRLVFALLFVSTAWANPKPAKPDKTEAKVLEHVKGMSEAQRGIELTPSIEYQRDHVTKSPAFGGGDAIGMIQTPPWHNDMRPYSDGGMVIRPPSTNDDMVIVPGTSWLPARGKLRRLWNVLQHGIDRGIETLIPSAGGT